MGLENKKFIRKLIQRLGIVGLGLCLMACVSGGTGGPEGGALSPLGGGVGGGQAAPGIEAGSVDPIADWGDCFSGIDGKVASQGLDAQGRKKYHFEGYVYIIEKTYSEPYYDEFTQKMRKRAFCTPKYFGTGHTLRFVVPVDSQYLDTVLVQNTLQQGQELVVRDGYVNIVVSAQHYSKIKIRLSGADHQSASYDQMLPCPLNEVLCSETNPEGWTALKKPFFHQTDNFPQNKPQIGQFKDQLQVIGDIIGEDDNTSPTQVKSYGTDTLVQDVTNPVGDDEIEESDEEEDDVRLEYWPD